jgi:hypothetical protein
VLTADIERFYESTTFFHVRRFFAQDLQLAGDLSDMLTSLCTRHGHLPLGSALNPLLSLLVHRNMFDEIARLCRHHDLRFTLYIDDLTISGNRIKPAVDRELHRIVQLHGLRLKQSVSPVHATRLGVEVTGTLLRRKGMYVPADTYRYASLAVGEAMASNHPKDMHIARGHISALRPVRGAAARALERKLGVVRTTERRETSPSRADAPKLQNRRKSAA